MEDVKNTKITNIVATLGPATDRENNLLKIINQGVNIVRLNMSHGNIDDHLTRIKKINDINQEHKTNVKIMADLQGPKVRISKFKDGSVHLNQGDKFILDYSLKDKLGDQNSVGYDFEALHENLNQKDILLIDDGKIRLEVIKKEAYKVTCIVKNAGVVSNNKGINKKHGGISLNTITAKDIEDIKNITPLNLDYIALSFVKKSQDIINLRKILTEKKCNAKIIAKIECAELISETEELDAVIKAADAVMIARGDLAVEIGLEKLMIAQKHITKKCILYKTESIVATQMMESMINSPVPTKAEISDVFNAVIDRNNAVMLSAESATGSYPVETVKYMRKICTEAESYLKMVQNDKL